MSVASRGIVLMTTRMLPAFLLRLARVRPWSLIIAAAIVTIGIFRLLPASYLQSVDSLTGRPGDALLFLAVATLAAAALYLNRYSQGESPRLVSEPAEAILENHLRLDHEIDKKLTEVVDDTESAALAMIQQVRQLHDTASRLVTDLGGTSPGDGDPGSEIIANVAHLVEIGTFIQLLPGKIERDLQSVKVVVNEIKHLSGLVEAVQAISTQSHMLAINTSIEASRSGGSGSAFGILADEMRKLASSSSSVAVSISQGLSRARQLVEEGMAAGIAESAHQIDGISQAIGSIRKLQSNFDDMTRYYNGRFEIVAQHNRELAQDIAEVLGQIQNQDVVRQCIERIRKTIGQRNEFFQDAVGTGEQGGAAFAKLPDRLTEILNAYVTEENRHKHSTRDAPGLSTELKIELF